MSKSLNVEEIEQFRKEIEYYLIIEELRKYGVLEVQDVSILEEQGSYVV